MLGRKLAVREINRDWGIGMRFKEEREREGRKERRGEIGEREGGKEGRREGMKRGIKTEQQLEEQHRTKGSSSINTL